MYELCLFGLKGIENIVFFHRQGTVSYFHVSLVQTMEKVNHSRHRRQSTTNTRLLTPDNHAGTNNNH
jgi:hypothetical protein